MTKPYAKLDGECDLAELVEGAASRLHEAIALLQTIDDAQLLADLPGEIVAKANHQAAVSMLAVLRRELDGVLDELEAAVQTNDVLERAVRSAASDGVTARPAPGRSRGAR